METRYKLRELDGEEFENHYDALTKDFFRVRTRNLFAGVGLPFDVYYPAVGGANRELRMKRLISRGQVYSTAFHEHLLQEGIEEVYLTREDEETFFTYFNQRMREAVQSETVSREVKTLLLYDNAESVIRKAFRERPNQTSVGMGRQLAENFALHLMLDKVGAAALFSVFSKNHNIFTHCVQVALLGMSFCHFLGWSRDDVTEFGLGALFHDVGKSTLDEAILNKPGKLSKEEFEAFKQHPALGYQMLRNAQVISKPQLHVVLHHHEAMDGSGYPYGLQGSEIHSFTRIARIADCFDNLTSSRRGRESLTPYQALQTMSEQYRRTFDSRFLEAFINFLNASESERPPMVARKIDFQVGIKIAIQLENRGVHENSTLVGLEEDKYLILQIPGLGEVEPLLQEGSTVVGRYLLAGTVYGFRSKILGYSLDPLKLLFLSFPDVVEDKNLRKNPRLRCFLPVEVGVDDHIYVGVVMDISPGGYQLVLKRVENPSLPDLAVDNDIVIRTKLLGEQAAESFPGKIRSIKMEEDKVIVGIQFFKLGYEALQALDRCIRRVMTMLK